MRTSTQISDSNILPDDPSDRCGLSEHVAPGLSDRENPYRMYCTDMAVRSREDAISHAF
jgi:hypothetical protein